MTRLLVSVRNLQEAQVALAAGVDLLDVKEPLHGALGAAAPEVVAAITRLASGSVPTSAALGELIDFDCQSGAAGLGVDYAKLGLAGCNDLANWTELWHAAWQSVPPSCGRIAVAYADHQVARAPPPLEVLEQADRASCAGLLVDTFDKRGGSLFAHCSESDLRQWCDRAQQAGLIFVLAGGLRGNEIERARQLGPDFVGVRGAACRGDRQQSIDGALIAALVEELHAHTPAAQRARGVAAPAN